MADSRVITVARPGRSSGMRAAVKSPLPMSSARAPATCCGRSAGTGTGGRTSTPLTGSLKGQAVRRADHAHEHGDGEQEVDAGGIQGDLARRRLLIVGGGHYPQNLLLVGPYEPPDVEQHDGAEPGAEPHDDI